MTGTANCFPITIFPSSRSLGPQILNGTLNPPEQNLYFQNKIYIFRINFIFYNINLYLYLAHG